MHSLPELEAKSLLDSGAYDFFAGGADDEQTLAESTEAWRAWRFLPRVLRDVSTINTATTLLGEPVSMPIGVAPIGYQQLLHQTAEAGMARGAAQSGALYTVSTRSSMAASDIAIAAPTGLRWFQTYVLRDRAFTLDLAKAARDAGCKAIVLTADMPVLARRTRDVANRFVLPPSISSQRRSGAPQLQTGLLSQDPAMSPDHIAWLRDEVGLPVVVKGVLHPQDAVDFVSSGASAIWVSAHGGRQLDGCVAPADALAPIVQAVGESAEVYVDGGIRRGADVLRSLALGARAAFVGRPAAWGLASGGEAGVANVLEAFREELELAMALAGVVDVERVPSDLVKRK